MNKKRDVLILMNAILMIAYLLFCAIFTYKDNTLGIWTTAIVGFLHAYNLKMISELE